MVDLLYELGANANEEQRTNICRELAASASRTGNAQVSLQRMWHTQDSHDQIMASARRKSLTR